MNIQTYIDELTAKGKCCFTLKEACKALSRPDNAVKLAIKRLKEKRSGLASPARGFYVIVPPEYRKAGCLPAEYFLPYLMAYWNKPYYVGLLSAAAIYAGYQ